MCVSQGQKQQENECVFMLWLACFLIDVLWVDTAGHILYLSSIHPNLDIPASRLTSKKRAPWTRAALLMSVGLNRLSTAMQREREREKTDTETTLGW